MRNKQIIVNDVDVSGCEFAVKPINDNRIKCHCAKGLLQIAKMQEQPESIKSGLCENNHNCYYKQSKRKEQENEELKKKLYQNFKEKEKLHLIIDRLLEASGYDTNTASAEDFEDVYENMRYEKQQLDQLKKTLTEIKEISKNFIKNVSDRYVETTPMYSVHKQILQKISEVTEN